MFLGRRSQGVIDDGPSIELRGYLVLLKGGHSHATLDFLPGCSIPTDRWESLIVHGAHLVRPEIGSYTTGDYMYDLNSKRCEL